MSVKVAARIGPNCGVGPHGFLPGNKCQKPGTKGEAPSPRAAKQARIQDHVQHGQSQAIAARVARAKASYRKANKPEQRYGEAQELQLIKGLGKGHQYPDNQAVDVGVHHSSGKGLHGIEVKTIVSSRNNKITMKKKPVARKLAWRKEEKGRVLHTVVFDHRHKFNGGENKSLWSGHEIYYKRGVGSFSIGAMHKVKSYRELSKLMETPEHQLPKAALGLNR